MATLRDAIIALTLRASQHSLGKTARRFLLGSAAAARRDPDAFVADTASVMDTMAWADALADAWTKAETLEHGGAFDACDLQVWIALAERAGVPAIPARPILTLHEDELSALSGTLPVPGFVARALSKAVGRSRAAQDAAPATGDDSASAGPFGPQGRVDVEALRERCMDAMDDVPENWMVRSHICGPSMLKSLAGAGLMADAQDSVARSSDFELGPGWVRMGNRRMVDAADARTVELFPQGHGTRITYLARPWIAAGRRLVGPDPHRHGTSFAGKGSWPCEWRVFVENGQVIGVASYYGWTGQATPLDAQKALEAAALAQRVVDAGVALGLRPAMMDVELLRRGAEQGATLPPRAADALARFGTGFSCTLDFLEGQDGMVLLEGGPAHTPVGGGHPCAFAGHGCAKAGDPSRTIGVALRVMPHVLLGSPQTWTDGDRQGCILTRDEAQALAAS